MDVIQKNDDFLAAHAGSNNLFASFRTSTRTQSGTTRTQVCGNFGVLGYDQEEIVFTARNCSSCIQSNVYLDGRYVGSNCSSGSLTFTPVGSVSVSYQQTVGGGWACLPFQPGMIYDVCSDHYEDSGPGTYEAVMSYYGINFNYVINSQ